MLFSRKCHIALVGIYLLNAARLLAFEDTSNRRTPPQLKPMRLFVVNIRTHLLNIVTDIGSKEDMNSSKILLVLFSLMLSLTAVSPAFAKKDLPAVNDEGMELVKNSDLATVYADPGADLSVYNRVWLQEATVAFKKNWRRDQNRGYSMKVQTSDMDKIKSEVAAIFKEVFTKELTDGGYEMAEEAGDDVLKVIPAIVDLDVTSPDIQRSTRTYSFSESAGEMTLNVELFDSVTNDKIAKATDRKRDYQRGYHEWRTSVSNRADARRMMTSWAKALRSALDEARSSTTP